MIEMILGIVVVLAYMKLNEMNDRLISMGKKINSLQYSLDLMQFGKSAIPKEKQKDEPLTITKSLDIDTKHDDPQKIEISKVRKEPKQEGLSERLQKRFGSRSLEDFLVGNLLLNISIVAFVLGVGFFLKYSIDQNWIPIWGRMFIGIGIAFSMIVAGIKLREKHPKLFSEVLFGGAIAILYLSIYAGFALEGFAFLSFQIAFVSMVAITVLAGFISVRYDSLATAVFGLIGGFSTPFLINNGSENLEALMIYILTLNLGVLYISFSKRWSLLNILAFILTSIIEMSVTGFADEKFAFLLAMFSTIFVIYSIVPFIHEIRKKEIHLDTQLTALFTLNIVVFLLITAKLFVSYGYDFKYFSSVTIATALYLFYYAYRLKLEGKFTNNLYSLITAQALGLLILTPAIIFHDEQVLSAVWAVEATILLYISQKSNNIHHLYFGMIGFVLAFLRYLFDLLDIYNSVDTQNYSHELSKQMVIATIVIGSFFYAYRFTWQEKLQKIADKYALTKKLVMGAIVMLFIFLNVEIINYTKLFFPNAQHVSTTLLWVVFGIVLFVVSLKQNISEGKNVAIGLILLAIIKAFFIDLAGADAIYRIILFIVVGVLLFVLAFYYKKREGVRKV